MPGLSNETIERRFVVAELRVIDRDDGPVLEGYAAVFDEWSEDLGGFRERIRPGAFSKTIREADVRGLWQHDPNYVLGRNVAGTLELVEDERGLLYRITPPDTQWARDVLVTMRRGDVNQSSFAFETVRDEWGEAADGFITRDLVEVKLYDVSPVTYPAYPQTSSQVRAMVAELRERASAPGEDPHPEALDRESESARARLDVKRRRVALLEV